MSRHTYRVLVKWKHRKWGPQTHEASAEGTSIRRGIANALLAFFSDKNSRDRRKDAHAELTLTARRLKTPPAR